MTFAYFAALATVLAAPDENAAAAFEVPASALRSHADRLAANVAAIPRWSTLIITLFIQFLLFMEAVADGMMPRRKYLRPIELVSD